MAGPTGRSAVPDLAGLAERGELVVAERHQVPLDRLVREIHDLADRSGAGGALDAQRVQREEPLLGQGAHHGGAYSRDLAGTRRYLATMSTNEKPSVEIPADDPPADLVIEDLDASATAPRPSPGRTSMVHYVGVAWSNGQQFDAVVGPRRLVRLPPRRRSGDHRVGPRASPA